MYLDNGFSFLRSFKISALETCLVALTEEFCQGLELENLTISSRPMNPPSVTLTVKPFPFLSSFPPPRLRFFQAFTAPALVPEAVAFFLSIKSSKPSRILPVLDSLNGLSTLPYSFLSWNMFGFSSGKMPLRPPRVSAAFLAPADVPVIYFSYKHVDKSIYITNLRLLNQISANHLRRLVHIQSYTIFDVDRQEELWLGVRRCFLPF